MRGPRQRGQRGASPGLHPAWANVEAPGGRPAGGFGPRDRAGRCGSVPYSTNRTTYSPVVGVGAPLTMVRGVLRS